ncbi:MAG: glycosyltransferase [Thermomicrobiales bacterium]
MIRSLEYGGAERQLVALTRGLHGRSHRVRVLVFYAGGPLDAGLRAAGVPVTVLGKRGRWDLVGFLRRFAAALREERAEIVHGYLGGPNILASLFRPLHRAKAVWGIRASEMVLSNYNWLSRVEAAVEPRLARTASLVIANSHAGRADAVAQGFPARTMVVIPNGVDVDRFRPDPEGRARVRAEFGIGDGQPLIGRVGRLDPQKDYPAFLRMAAAILPSRPDARFLCVGAGPAEALAALRSLAVELGVADAVIWAGARDDMAAVYGACDVTVSSSAFGEGTPNVVAESMACGVPCVVTDVGDSAAVVADPAMVAAKGDVDALAAIVLATLDRRERDGIDGAALRASVIARLSMEALITRTERALEPLLAAKGRRETAEARS